MSVELAWNLTLPYPHCIYPVQGKIPLMSYEHAWVFFSLARKKEVVKKKAKHVR